MPQRFDLDTQNMFEGSVFSDMVLLVQSLYLKSLTESQAATLLECHPLQEGDLVVMGSDGLFDNLFPTEIAQIVARI